MNRCRVKIIAGALILGTLYGFISGIMNQNGAQSIPPSDITDEAIEWNPSLLWLPSFVLCHTRGLSGMKQAKIGYYFTSEANRVRYIFLSTLLGFILGSLALFSSIARTWQRATDSSPQNTNSTTIPT